MSAIVELAIFGGLLYWFFTSCRVADMLEVLSAHVGRACGLGGGSSDDRSGPHALRRAVHRRVREHAADIYNSVEVDRMNRVTSLYRSKDSVVVPAPSLPVVPSTGLACIRCTPESRKSYLDNSTPQNRRDSTVLSVFDIGRRNYSKGGLFSRYFRDVVRVCDCKHWDFTDVQSAVIKDSVYQDAIEEVTRDELNNPDPMPDDADYKRVKSNVERRAYRLLTEMGATWSNRILRILAWVCYKVFPHFSQEGTWLRHAGLQSVKRASATGHPMIFIPLHRSHVDYILVTLILLLSDLRPPLVAAGDNLKIPLFGWLLRCVGAFFIRRRSEGTSFKEDTLYNAVLRSYILNSLEAKNNLEFFIEGGRTRTGKPQMPKAGILSVIVDAYNEGRIEDALLVPVSINYERLVDGNFVREQLGQTKKMETFWSPLAALWKMLRTNHGGIRVHFNQPVSLKEMIKSFNKFNSGKQQADHLLLFNNNLIASPHNKKFLPAHSNSSLYGSDVTEEHKALVDSIATHLVYDASNATSIMSTNVVTFLLLTLYRNGVDMETLCQAVDELVRHLTSAGRHVAFNGYTKHVVQHTVDIMKGVIVYENGTVSVCNEVEAAYYAATVCTHYAPEAIVVTALESIVQDPHRSHRMYVSRSELIESATQLCQIMSSEYILSPVCVSVTDLVNEAVDLVVEKSILCSMESEGGIEEEQWSRRFARRLEGDDEEDGVRHIKDVKYTISNHTDALRYRKCMLASMRPLLESYTTTVNTLKAEIKINTHEKHLTLVHRDFVKKTLANITERLENGLVCFGEAQSTDAIRNCLRVLRQYGVIDLYSQGRDRFIAIKSTYLEDKAITALCEHISKFNVDTPLLKYD